MKQDAVPGKVLTLSCNHKEFYKLMLEFMKPIHGLTSNQMDVFASFLYQRYLLSQSITNSDLLDQIVMSPDSRRVVRESLDMTPTHFQVVISTLKKKGMIQDGKINKKFIPSIKESTELFKLTVCFTIKDET